MAPPPGVASRRLRGLTAIATPQGQALLAAVEGYAGRIVRIDCGNGTEISELEIQAHLDRAWASRTSYVITAYNDMTPVPSADGVALLIGIEAFFHADAPVPPGHARVDGLDGGGWYFLRHPDGRYDLHRLGATQPVTGLPLVATRAIAASPFGDDQIYFAGYDANKRPARNTAWILRVAREWTLR